MAGPKKTRTRKPQPKKAVRKRARAKLGAAVVAAKKERLRARIKGSVDARVDEALKLALRDTRGLGPDELAAGVKTRLAELGSDVLEEVLRCIGPVSIIKFEDE